MHSLYIFVGLASGCMKFVALLAIQSFIQAIEWVFGVYFNIVSCFYEASFCFSIVVPTDNV